MILSVQGSERHLYPTIVDSMHRIGAKVFDERLGWSVNVVDGREIDVFDEANPLYLISVDERTRRVRRPALDGAGAHGWEQTCLAEPMPYIRAASMKAR